MKIARQALADVLKVVEPALASKELIDELTHVWLDGETISAYNDLIAIEMPFKSEIVGGMRGALLGGLLEATSADEVTLEEAKSEKSKKGKNEPSNEVIFYAGGNKSKSNIRLPLLDLDRALFTFPKTPNRNCDVSADFVEIVGKMLISVGADTSIPDQLGVTFIREDDDLDFYTSDSNTLTHMYMTAPEGWPDDRFVIPTLFCEQLVKLCKEGGKLAISENEVIAVSKAGVRLFGRLVDVERPSNFPRIVNEHVPEDAKQRYVTIPSEFKNMVARSLLVVSARDGDPVRLTFTGKNLNMYARSERAEMDDDLELDKEPGDAKKNVNPALIDRALASASQMLLAEKCLIFISASPRKRGTDSFLHLISTMPDRK